MTDRNIELLNTRIRVHTCNDLCADISTSCENNQSKKLAKPTNHKNQQLPFKSELLTIKQIDKLSFSLVTARLIYVNLPIYA